MPGGVAGESGSPLPLCRSGAAELFRQLDAGLDGQNRGHTICAWHSESDDKSRGNTHGVWQYKMASQGSMVIHWMDKLDKLESR
jgi:hypothetical protein